MSTIGTTATYITVNQDDYRALERERDQARRIARALYRILLRIEDSSYCYEDIERAAQMARDIIGEQA